ncbi:MAG TPA: hypothetical protein PLZ51_12500 [Aggregatilineales bacterium]|nr:hypothetical protein [Aggregatilineales bacterium]
MKLNHVIDLAVQSGGIVGISPQGDYELIELKNEDATRAMGYEHLMAIIKTGKTFLVSIHIEQPNKSDGNESLIVKTLGAMLNPKLDGMKDPKASQEMYTEIDQRIAEKDAKAQQDYIEHLYRFAEDCVRMELNARGYPEDEPMLCFSSGNDDPVLYDDDDDTQEIEAVSS